MNRLLATMRLDLTVQWRNKLYIIGIAVALLIGIGLAQALPPGWMATALPAFLMISVSGTVLIYVISLLIFEKDEGTLNAQLVAPLRLGEYLNSKLVTLALLALVETTVTVLVAYGPDGFNIGLLLLGVLTLSSMFTLMGLIMVVRYRSITDVLMPLVVLVLLLELPLLHFLGWAPHPLWLLLPSSAPTMLLWGAWNPVSNLELAYGIGYSLLWIGGLAFWAQRAFQRHIIIKAGG